MNVKRTYTVSDHNDDFETYVKVVDVKGLDRDFPMDRVTEVLVSPFEGGPYAEVRVRFFVGVRNDANFIVDAENLEVLEKELKKFKGKDLFFYKHKPKDLRYEQPEVTLPDYAKVNNGILHIVTPSKMYNVPLHSIQTITVADGLVCIRYINYLSGGGCDTIQLPETHYPIITDAICNAPNTTSNINSSIAMNTITRSF